MFFIKDFFSKCDQNRIFLRIWSHLLKNSLMEIFIFLCGVAYLHVGMVCRCNSKYKFAASIWLERHKTIRDLVKHLRGSFFAEAVKDWKPLTTFTNISIIYVSQEPKYASIDTFQKTWINLENLQWCLIVFTSYDIWQCIVITCFSVDVVVNFEIKLDYIIIWSSFIRKWYTVQKIYSQMFSIFCANTYCKDSRPEVFCKKGKTFLLKKRLWRRYFPVNFVQFLRTPFL